VKRVSVEKTVVQLCAGWGEICGTGCVCCADPPALFCAEAPDVNRIAPQMAAMTTFIFVSRSDRKASEQ